MSGGKHPTPWGSRRSPGLMEGEDGVNKTPPKSRQVLVRDDRQNDSKRHVYKNAKRRQAGKL